MDSAGKGSAIAALMCGVSSIIFMFISPLLLGFPLGAIGLYLAIKAKNEGFSGKVYTAGLVCSIVGIVLSVVVFFAETFIILVINQVRISPIRFW